MASQIDQLRTQFNGMNTTQQKEFIDKLRVKLQGANNAEYTKFLNECVHKHNTAVSEGSNAKGVKVASPTYAPTKNTGAEISSSVCSHCGESVKPTQKICLSCGMPNQSFKKIDPVSLILAIAGIALRFPPFGFLLMIPLLILVLIDEIIDIGRVINHIGLTFIDEVVYTIPLIFSVIGFKMAKKKQATMNTKLASKLGIAGIVIGVLHILLLMMSHFV